MVLFMDLPTEVRQQVLKYATFAYDAEVSRYIPGPYDQRFCLATQLNSIHIHSRFFDHDRDFFANRSDFEAGQSSDLSTRLSTALNSSILKPCSMSSHPRTSVHKSCPTGRSP